MRSRWLLVCLNYTTNRSKRARPPPTVQCPPDRGPPHAGPLRPQSIAAYQQRDVGHLRTAGQRDLRWTGESRLEPDRRYRSCATSWKLLSATHFSGSRDVGRDCAADWSIDPLTAAAREPKGGVSIPELTIRHGSSCASWPKAHEARTSPHRAVLP